MAAVMHIAYDLFISSQHLKFSFKWKILVRKLEHTKKNQIYFERIFLLGTAVRLGI